MTGRVVRKLLLTNHLALGDIVVLTAAVRDLHRCYPGQFLTGVDTTCPELWENYVHIQPLTPNDPEVERIACDYPLIQLSNQAPYHMIHGFIDGLNARLGMRIYATDFSGDIPLSAEERQSPSPLEGLTGRAMPYWLILAGGKNDATIKWWDTERYQAVVDFFRGRILFVQMGASQDHHPALRGVLDLRGRTNVRQLVRWVYHAQGVLCGVTGLMHLAAAVEMPPSQSARKRAFCFLAN